MQTIWQSLCLQYFRTNPHDEDFFVIGAVENADATTLWQALCGAPQNCQPRPWPEKSAAPHAGWRRNAIAAGRSTHQPAWPEVFHSYAWTCRLCFTLVGHFWRLTLSPSLTLNSADLIFTESLSEK
jgi:hypothetical protein